MFGHSRLRVQADTWVRDDTSMNVALDPTTAYRSVTTGGGERPSLLVTNGDVYWNIHAPDPDHAQEFADAVNDWVDQYRAWDDDGEPAR